jgi:hypothetical protein
MSEEGTWRSDYPARGVGDINVGPPIYPSIHLIEPPQLSDWRGHICGVDYIPTKGNEPNRFHRFMQRLAFGIVWRKVKQ